MARYLKCLATESVPLKKLCSGHLLTTPLRGCYTYTSSEAKSALTSEQKDFYEENGFLVIKNLVPKQELAKYQTRFQDICTGKVMIPSCDVAVCKSEFDQNKRAFSKLQGFQWDDVLFEYCRLPEVLKYVKSFIGPNVMVMHTMLINKHPDSGTLISRRPMHQDSYYFAFHPLNRVVCSWTAMQKIDRNNGCIAVIPGTHKGDRLEHDYPEWEGGLNRFFFGIKNYNPEKDYRVWVEAEEGDTIFFHPILIHGSGSNKTDVLRKSITCRYAASECEYMEKYDSTQEHMAKELKEYASHMLRTNDRVTLKDYWKSQARLVCGDKINL